MGTTPFRIVGQDRSRIGERREVSVDGAHFKAGAEPPHVNAIVAAYDRIEGEEVILHNDSGSFACELLRKTGHAMP